MLIEVDCNINLINSTNNYINLLEQHEIDLLKHIRPKEFNSFGLNKLSSAIPVSYLNQGVTEFIPAEALFSTMLRSSAST